MEIAAEIAGRPDRTLIFVRTKHGADRLAKQLTRAGIEAGAIHGDLSQNQRQRALDGFAAGYPRVLVATDVAARGLHIDDVGLVVHFDPPNDHKDYLHRSGRTGRAGATGTVLALVDPAQVREVARLQEAAGVSPARHRVQPGAPAVRDIATSGTPIPPPPPRPERAASASPAGPLPARPRRPLAARARRAPADRGKPRCPGPPRQAAADAPARGQLTVRPDVRSVGGRASADARAEASRMPHPAAFLAPSRAPVRRSSSWPLAARPSEHGLGSTGAPVGSARHAVTAAPAQDARLRGEPVARAVFEGLPARYDRLAYLLSMGQDRRWRRAVVSRTASGHPALALDVATGPAGIALAVAGRTGADVVGVDLNEPMLRAGVARTRRPGGRGRVRLAVGPGG